MLKETLIFQLFFLCVALLHCASHLAAMCAYQLTVYALNK